MKPLLFLLLLWPGISSAHTPAKVHAVLNGNTVWVSFNIFPGIKYNDVIKLRGHIAEGDCRIAKYLNKRAYDWLKKALPSTVQLNNFAQGKRVIYADIYVDGRDISQQMIAARILSETERKWCGE